eukprot:COSAG05_NODE_6779_length_904_cov_2.493168_1_plen_224_part_00
MSPGNGKYGKYICGATTLRKWRQKTGEHVPFHTTGVVSVRGDGVFLRDASGVVHKCAGAGHAGFADGLNPYGLCHTTPSGHMDGQGMLKVATLLAAAMGKEAWDHTKPWNEQPARCNATFRQEPVIWLLDGHYSHHRAVSTKSLIFRTFSRNNDVWGVWCVLGAPSVKFCQRPTCISNRHCVPVVPVLLKYRKVPIISYVFINRSIFCSDRLKTISLCSGLTD